MKEKMIINGEEVPIPENSLMEGQILAALSLKKKHNKPKIIEGEFRIIDERKNKGVINE